MSKTLPRHLMELAPTFGVITKPFNSFFLNSALNDNFQIDSTFLSLSAIYLPPDQFTTQLVIAEDDSFPYVNGYSPWDLLSIQPHLLFSFDSKFNAPSFQHRWSNLVSKEALVVGSGSPSSMKSTSSSAGSLYFLMKIL